MKEVDERYLRRESQTKVAIDAHARFENSVKRYVPVLVISFIFLVSMNINAHIATAEDPCTIYGTVKNGNGAMIEGATITVENSNTNERNTDGGDTITGNPIPIRTDTEGKYTFELLNLQNGYSNGDEITVTAEKDGVSSSESIIISAGSWGARVDLTLGIEGASADDPWQSILSNLWILIILLIVIIVILAAMLLRRKSGEVPKSGQIGDKGTSKKDFEEPREIGVYVCPECGAEINAADTSCPKCGVTFAEAEE